MPSYLYHKLTPGHAAKHYWHQAEHHQLGGACLQVLRLGRLLQALRLGLKALRLHDGLHHDWVRLCMLAVHVQLVRMRLRTHATQQVRLAACSHARPCPPRLSSTCLEVLRLGLELRGLLGQRLRLAGRRT